MCIDENGSMLADTVGCLDGRQIWCDRRGIHTEQRPERAGRGSMAAPAPAHSRRPPPAATMRARPALLLAIATLLTCLQLVVIRACELEEAHNGCKIYGASCSCGYGCKTEYIFRNQKDCLSALREPKPNVCHRMPCLRGICIQTMQDPGFACKCEGTGFYGKRCEKACPTIPMRGLVFPHECVVI